MLIVNNYCDNIRKIKYNNTPIEITQIARVHL